ncbi:MAG TPA: diacylglycerol kinase family protein [Polyangiales bacterium]|nr:diacylglycerol kinase family protein [Polyangiales bacterium]
MNPAAGNGKCGKLARAALERLRSRGVALEVHETTAPGDASKLAKRAQEQGKSRFLAVGGDGTAFEILNGLSSALAQNGHSQRLQLGFLPLGTGNSFLRDFGAGDIEHATEALVADRRRTCDVLRLEHTEGVTHSLNLLSFGFVADICSITNSRFKALGAGGYGLGVITALAHLHTRPLRMRVDRGELWEQDIVFVSVCNSRYTGGRMLMAPYADTGDGQLDIVVCGAMDRRTLLSTFPKIFSGQHVHHHQITAARARSIELFESQPIDLMIDGEVLRRQPTKIEVLPRALDVLV